jgi:hypothetical protein
MGAVDVREVARATAQRMADALGVAHEVRGPGGVERFEPSVEETPIVPGPCEPAAAVHLPRHVIVQRIEGLAIDAYACGATAYNAVRSLALWLDAGGPAPQLETRVALLARVGGIAREERAAGSARGAALLEEAVALLAEQPERPMTYGMAPLPAEDARRFAVPEPPAARAVAGLTDDDLIVVTMDLFGVDGFDSEDDANLEAIAEALELDPGEEAVSQATIDGIAADLVRLLASGRMVPRGCFGLRASSAEFAKRLVGKSEAEIIVLLDGKGEG